jgi:hypothetical protein
MPYPDNLARMTKLIARGFCRDGYVDDCGRRPPATGGLTLIGLDGASAGLIVAPPGWAGARQRRGRA